MKLETATKILHISVGRDELAEYNRVIANYVEILSKGMDIEPPEKLKTLQRLSQEFNKILTDAMSY